MATLAMNRNVESLGQFGGEANAVSVQGNRAAVGIGPSLAMLDVTNPSAPALLGRLRLPGMVADVCLSGDYAYVAAEGAGLRIIDVADPTRLHEAGHCVTPGEAQAVAVRDGYAYIAAGDAGLRVIDVTDPSAPQELGAYDSPGKTQDVFVPADGDYAYLADGGLRVINIADPTDPWLQGVGRAGDIVTGVHVAGEYAYVSSYNSWGGGGAMSILRVDNPADPRPLPYPVNPVKVRGHVNSVSVSGNYAYLAGDDFVTIDITDPTAPAIVGSPPAPATVYGICIAGGRIYLAASGGGLRIYDAGAGPANPAPVGAYDEQAGGANDIALSGSHAYLVLGTPPYRQSTGSLYALDVADNTAPAEAWRYHEPGAYTVAVSGTYAYLGAGESLRIFDLSNPEDPVLKGTHSAEADVFGLALSGNYALLAMGSFGVGIVNVADPAAPDHVSTFGDVYYACDVAVYGHYALIANERSGLVVLDISNPENPTQVGSYHPPCSTLGVSVYDHYAYLAVAEGDLVIVDLADPAHPTYAGRLSTPGNAIRVQVAGNLAYVAADSAGLRVVSLRDPLRPYEIGGADTPGTARRLAVAGSLAYVADGEGGLAILRYRAPELNNKLYLPLVHRH